MLLLPSPTFSEWIRQQLETINTWTRTLIQGTEFMT